MAYYDSIDKNEIEKAFKAKAFEFHQHSNIKRPPYLLEIEANDIDTGRPFRKGFLCKGETVTLSGKEKSKKSFFGYMMLMSALMPNGAYQNIRCNMHPNKKVMLFDTELPPYEFSRRMQKIIKACGYEKAPDTFLAWSLKQFRDPVTIVQFIIRKVTIFGEECKIDGTKGVGIIMIDKLLDLLRDTMSKTQVNELINVLGALQAEYGFMMIWTMHQNRRDSYTNGTAGVEANKEISYLFNLECQFPDAEDSETLVTTGLKRHKEAVPKFNIAFDDDGYPVSLPFTGV
jgi:hypothetical protein